MNRTLGVVWLILGIAILVYGLDASGSLASSVSKFFSGAPTNKSIFLLTIGGLFTVLGFVSLFGSGSR